MAIVNTAKANAVMRLLASDLKLRFANGAGINTVRQTVDSNGYPELFLSVNGVETAGNPVIYVRIDQISAVSTDVFGNPENAYAPHNMDIAWELSATAGLPEPAVADILTTLWECFPQNIATNVYQLANGTAVNETNVDAASPNQSFDWLRWPTKGV